MIMISTFVAEIGKVDRARSSVDGGGRLWPALETGWIWNVLACTLYFWHYFSSLCASSTSRYCLFST